MILLERLSNSNFEQFKNLSLERFSTTNYDKDFFEYYEKERFFLKIFFKKFVKLFVYNEKIVGYIWYEIPFEIPVRVWSLYIKEEYLKYLNPDILKSFDNTILSYETPEDETNNIMLKNLGFTKVKPSVLMSMNLNYYSNELQIKTLVNKLENSINLSEKINLLYKSNINKLNISIDTMEINKDEELRCEMQNSIFSNISRVPLEISDIENDIQQDYYIENLSLFLKVNDIAIGYGQVIFNRNMYTVVNFGIISDFRGMGFGKVLLNEIIERCRETNITDLYIRVEENNLSAFKLYNWIGFSPKITINKWERK